MSEVNQSASQSVSQSISQPASQPASQSVSQSVSQSRPFDKEVRKIVSGGFHKHDKLGRPCYIEHTGRIDTTALLKLPADQFVGWHIWNNEKQIERMTDLSKKFERPIETMVHIHDMAGATMMLRKALSAFKRLAKLDQDYYPERMGKIFIVNTPWVFPVLWKIAKIFLDPKTRAKCVVLKSSELHKLCDYFDPEDLPEELGGTCQCENGCLPPVPKHMLEVKDNPQLTEQTIGAKKTFAYTVDCDNQKAELSIAWYFKATSKDIQFGIKFKPKPHSGWKENANEIDEIWVEELEPISDCESSITGFYAPPCPGICTLVWDNSNCKWLSRTIKYHVMVSEAVSDSDEEISTNGNKENTQRASIV
ncbi:retinal-binding protein-like isoform X2 [Oculina patagonica]